MKNQKSKIILCSNLSLLGISRKRKHTFYVFTMFLSLVFYSSCEFKDTAYDAVKEAGTSIFEEDTTTKNVHLAFAGGGWRAHTGHSAWMISLLENDSTGSKNTLDSVLTNVKTISSNSGGSWFSTMLMYSDSFVNDIQAPKAIDTWGSTGWIGGQKKHFANATYTGDWGRTYLCSHHLGSNPGEIEEGEYIKCISDHYAGSVYYWKKLIDSLVYKDYPLGSMKLSDNKQSWATDKSLLIAASMLNNSVVLNKESGHDYHQYYQACLQDSAHRNNAPVLEGDEIRKTTTCTSGLPKDVSAVTFTSLGENSNHHPLPFLRQLYERGSLYKIGYTLDYMIDTPPHKTIDITLPLNHDEVPVMTAAAASSAAGGFVASEHVMGMFDKSYIGEDEALSFQLGNGTVKYVDTKNYPYDSLRLNKIIRLADGGPVDNSGVAQIVSFLQKTNRGNGFNIVAFDNVADKFSPHNGAKVGIDIASLFGAPDPFSGKFLGETYTVETPKLKIFVADTMNNTPVTWSPAEKNGQQIFYTKYNVRTIKNEALGISPDSTGTLHAFTFASKNIGIIPDRGNTDFQIYDDMINYIHESLNTLNAKGEKEGLNHLKKALGRPTTD